MKQSNSPPITKKQERQEEESSYEETVNPNILRKKIKKTTTKDGDGNTAQIVIEEKKEILPPFLPPIAIDAEEQDVQTMEEYIAPKLREVMQPVYNLMDMIGQEAGKPMYYRFSKTLTEEQRQTPLVWHCKTTEEFYEKNRRYLGEEIIEQLKQWLDNTKMPKAVKQEQLKTPDVGGARPIKNALIGMSAKHAQIFKDIFDQELIESNDWIFEHLPYDAIGLVLGHSKGCLELAAMELNFNVKDLLVSREVLPMFAQYVARKFVSPKENAQGGRGVSGRTAQCRIYSGVFMNQQDNKWLYASKMWFKNVKLVDNPYWIKSQNLIIEYKNQLKEIFETVYVVTENFSARSMNNVIQNNNTYNTEQKEIAEQIFLRIRQLTQAKTELYRLVPKILKHFPPESQEEKRRNVFC